MAEVRTYVAPDLVRAKQKLRADADALAERGLHPTWTVWVSGRRGWLRRRPGELVVQFDPVRPAVPNARLGAALSPLLLRLRALVEAEARITAEIGALAQDVPAPAATSFLTALRERRRRRRDLQHESRRVEGLIREVERELARLQSGAKG